mgnify:CR=1 FL=1
MSLAKTYVKVGRSEDAMHLMEKYAKQCKTAKYVFTHAGVMLDCNQPLKALMLYVKTTMLSDADINPRLNLSVGLYSVLWE